MHRTRPQSDLLGIRKRHLLTFLGGCLAICCNGGCSDQSTKKSAPISRESLIDSVKGAGERGGQSVAKNAGGAGESQISGAVAKNNAEVQKGGQVNSLIPPLEGAADGLDLLIEQSSSSESGKGAILDGETKIAEPIKVVRPVEDDPTADWADKTTVPKKTYELNFIGDKPVGYTVRDLQFRPGVDKDVVRTELTAVSRVSIDGQVKNQTTTMVTHELQNGSLLRLEGTLTVGDLKNEFTGNVEGTLLKMDTVSNGKRARTSIPWNEEFRGPFAIEQSLIRSPMRDDEVRVLRHLDPMIGRVIETTLQALDVAKSPTMLEGSVPLREIAVRQRSGDQTNSSTIWVDRKGEILKSLHTSVKLRSFRVEELATTEYKRLMALNDVEIQQIPLEVSSDEAKQVMRNAANRQSITYRVTSKGADPFETVSRHSLQSIHSANARSADVTVYRTVSDAKDAKIIIREDSAPSEATRIDDWIDPNSPRWIEYVKDLWGHRAIEGLSEHDKAILIRDALLERWKLTPPSRKVANLANLIASNTGSSWEQALVLGNLCRSLKIPTRMALGFVVSEEANGYVMKLDAWLEVFDSTQWFSIDPKDKSLDASPNRIKILESYFQDSRLFEELAKVSHWADGVVVEVVAE